MSYDTRRYNISKPSPRILGVHHTGITITHPGHSARSILPTYSLTFILSGKGRYRIRGQEHFLHAGQGYLIPPHELCLYDSDVSDPWTYIYANFSGEGDKALVHAMGLDSDRLTFSFSELPAVREEVEKMFEEAEKQPPNSLSVTGHFLLAVSALAEAEADHPRKPSDAEYARQAIEFIHGFYPYPISVSDMANSIGIDRSYLHRVFRQVTGTTPERYLTAYRLQCARDLMGKLAHPRLTDIAIGVGFYDAAHFSRVFRAAYGMSPRTFLKEACPDPQPDRPY